jgi:chromosome segregation ATPase
MMDWQNPADLILLLDQITVDLRRVRAIQDDTVRSAETAHARTHDVVDRIQRQVALVQETTSADQKAIEELTEELDRVSDYAKRAAASAEATYSQCATVVGRAQSAQLLWQGRLASAQTSLSAAETQLNQAQSRLAQAHAERMRCQSLVDQATQALEQCRRAQAQAAEAQQAAQSRGQSGARVQVPNCNKYESALATARNHLSSALNMVSVAQQQVSQAQQKVSEAQAEVSRCAGALKIAHQAADTATAALKRARDACDAAEDGRRNLDAAQASARQAISTADEQREAATRMTEHASGAARQFEEAGSGLRHAVRECDGAAELSARAEHELRGRSDALREYDRTSSNL